LNAPDVWHAMQAKGLGVLVSWDAEATSLDNYFAGVAFFGGMRGQGVTVAQSIQQAQAAGYGKSTNNGQTARLGYFGDGTNAYTDTNPSNTVYTVPPSSVRNIGDALNEKQISWAWFGDQFNRYLNDKYDTSAQDA